MTSIVRPTETSTSISPRSSCYLPCARSGVPPRVRLSTVSSRRMMWGCCAIRSRHSHSTAGPRGCWLDSVATESVLTSASVRVPRWCLKPRWHELVVSTPPHMCWRSTTTALQIPHDRLPPPEVACHFKERHARHAQH